MKTDRYFCGLELKFLDTSEEVAAGTFEGYGAIFGNVDSYGDVIAKGAFKDTLRDWKKRGSLPKMLLQHGSFMGPAEDGIPVGAYTEMREDDTGLYLKGNLFALDTQKGKYIYEGMKAGVLDGLSIGYKAREVAFGKKPEDPARTIKKADLFEVSIVTFPANDIARTSAVKSVDIQSRRDFEGFLRDAGFSRAEAKRIACHGFDDSQRDADESAKELLAASRRLLERI